MTGRRFVDSNVLLYLLDARSPEKQLAARRLLQGERGTLVVSTQVLQEIYATATRKLGVPEDKAAAFVDDVAQLRPVRVDVPLIRDAIARSRASLVSFWDALIIEAALASACDTLYTEDLNAGQRFGPLTVVNPFFTGVRDSAASFAEEAVLAPRAPPPKSRGGARGRRSLR